MAAIARALIAVMYQFATVMLRTRAIKNAGRAISASSFCCQVVFLI